MDTQAQIAKIKRQLAITGDDEVLEDLFTDWNSAALSICNRAESTDTMLAIVRDITIAAYRKRGAEGMTGHTAGGQSYSYEKLRQELFDRLIQAGQRVFRP